MFLWKPWLSICCSLQEAAAAAAAAEPAPVEHYEPDQWLLDFANLFREMLNVEPERHLDLTQIGWERLQACSPALTLNYQAEPFHGAGAPPGHTLGMKKDQPQAHVLPAYVTFWTVVVCNK